MSSIGDAPLARTRKRKNAAQADAEQAKLTAKARQVERATAIGPSIPVADQSVIPTVVLSPMAALNELLRSVSGVAWLRIVPLDDELVTHWYIKYNRGRWNGYYLYYGQGVNDSCLDAIEFLITRFSEVVAGIRKPHKDTRYSG